MRHVTERYDYHHLFTVSFFSLLDDCNVSPCKKLLVDYYLLRHDDQYHSISFLFAICALEVTSFGAKLPLLLASSPRGGRGVFAGASIEAGQEVEVCPLDD